MFLREALWNEITKKFIREAARSGAM